MSEKYNLPEDEFALARKRMVEEQIVARGIQDPRILAVMGSVPRHYFVSPDDLAWAYADGALRIGHGQTISQPYIVALMTELLKLDPSNHVLEVGTGSGYQAAVLGELTAEVNTVEVIPQLAIRAEKTLTDLGYSHIHVHTGDGSSGWNEAAPYDRILVAAAAPEVSRTILGQLVEGGLLIIPVGSRSLQQLEVWRRAGQEFSREINLQVCFVPLVGQFGWK